MFGVVLVSKSDIAAMVRLDTATVDDNSEDDEPDHGDDFDHSQRKFNLGRAFSEHTNPASGITYLLRIP